MKTKVFFIFSIILFFSYNTQAQESKITDTEFRMGIGINGGIPIVIENYNCSFSADLRLEYDFSKKTAVTLTSGFTNLYMNQNMKSFGFIPIKGGFKYFLWERQLYALGEVGGGFAVTNDYNQNTYVWSPGIGYTNKYIDLSLRYEAYTEYETDQILVRLAYRI